MRVASPAAILTLAVLALAVPTQAAFGGGAFQVAEYEVPTGSAGEPTIGIP